MKTIKQLCEQSKQVSILTDVQSKAWNDRLHILEAFNLLQF